MAKTLDFMDTWFKMQTEFVDNVAGLQKDFIENFIEASKKFQETLLAAAREGLPGKPLAGLYEIWFSTTVNSTRALSDEVIRMQETWKESFKKQLDAGREMFRSFAQSQAGTGQT